MEELKGFEERVGPRRAKGTAHGEHKDRDELARGAA